MEFVNETDLAAALFRATLVDETKMFGFVVAKVVYRILPNGAVERDVEHTVAIEKEPQPGDFGEMPGDVIPWKRAVDVWLLGNAYAHKRGVVESEVRLRVADVERRIAVLGDRQWERRRNDLVVGAPRPFEVIPLTWQAAYGGQASVRGSKLPHAYNPKGKGYLVEKENAEGTPLPNLEDPATRIERWDDNPIPLSPAPLQLDSQFFTDEMLKIRGTPGAPREEDFEFAGLAFNWAHPQFRMASLQGGEAVEVVGVTPGKPLRFVVPTAPLAVQVSLEDRHYTFPARVDTIALFAEESRFLLIHRCHFTYSYRREELRVARLRFRHEAPRRLAQFT